MRANSPIEVLDDVRRRLMGAGRLDEAGWARAINAQAQTGERVDHLLVKLGLAPELEVAQSLAACLGMPMAAAEDYADEPVDLGPVRPEFLRANGLAPLRPIDGALRVATADPLETFAVDALRKASGRAVIAYVGAPSDIRAAIDRLAQDRTRGAARACGADLADEDVERLRDLASEAPIIRMVNDLVDAAVAKGASDIHLEPETSRLRVRLRVDGGLRDHASWPLSDAPAVLSRIKVMARLDIAERRLPQDGRFKTTSRGREIDLRVSTLPAIHGEAAVLRVLDPAARRAGLDDIGLPPDDLALLRALIGRPNGLILMTGPTGSGKTTTLYAALTEASAPDVKTLTIEDPIEYRLPGVVQIQVKPEIGLGFAHALRAFLRHDPDTIMVGEIRDRETAEIAAQAALTGHLVFSTLHTNSAAGAVERLRDMGVPRDVLSPALVGLVAQRLVRKLCAACCAPFEHATDGLAAEARAAGVDADPARLRRAVGCPACDGSGYRGRRAVIEVLSVDAAMRRSIHGGASAETIEAEARARGLRSLRQNALALLFTGETSLEELGRVAREA